MAEYSVTNPPPSRRRPTIPPNSLSHAPSAFNGLLSVGGYGARACRVIRVSYGLEIITGPQDEAKDSKSFYPLATHDSSFAVTIAHVKWAEREAFNEWVRTYMRAVTSGIAVAKTMRVIVPVRNFVRHGVPQGPLVYGDQSGQTNPHTGEGYFLSRINLVAASNPVSEATASRYRRAPDNTSSRYFYPSSQQVSGAESLDGTIFDEQKPYAAASDEEQRASFNRARSRGLIDRSMTFERWQQITGA